MPSPTTTLNDPRAASAALAQIAIEHIVPSPFNMRKEFAGIDDLAQSIKAQGLLENLVVRPDPKKAGRFQLIAGERRWRALKQLGADQAPCRVIEVDDAGAMAAQIVENLQREGIAPLDEAEAFAQLQLQDQWTVAKIAEAVGKTPRFVQQRLAIAGNLAPALKAKLAKGEITVEVARTLAGAPKALQLEVASRSWTLGRGADAVRSELLGLMVPEAHAGFDLAQYKGDVVEEGGKRYLADVAQFDRLQLAAAQAAVEKLRAGLWKTAQLLGKASSCFNFAWGDTLERVYGDRKVKSTGRAKVAADQLTAIVWIDGNDRRIRQATGVVPAAIADKARPSRSGPSYPKPETAPQRRKRHDFNARLVEACANKPDLGERALLVALVATYGARTTYDSNAVKRALPAFLPPALVEIEGTRGAAEEKRAARAWEIVKGMKLPEVQKAVAGYAALAFIWNSNDGRQPKGVTASLAQALRVKPRDVATPGKAKAPAVADKVRPKGGK
jgi:ParB/RepB/Spo0J family partition protein